MELIAKAPQTLSVRNDCDKVLSKAESDCTGTRPRLPLDLLIEIIAQLPNLLSACSFARVNKVLHHYSIRRIYADIYIETRRFLDVLAKGVDRDNHWIHEYSSVSEMLQIFDAKGAKDLYGLFSRSEHLTAVRRLWVRNTTIWDHRKMPITRSIVSKILREIFNGATALQTANVDDSYSRDAALPFCLMKISYAHTFTSLSIASLSLGTWEAIFRGVPSLKEISCDNFDLGFLELRGSEYANHRIESLIYRWYPQIREGSLAVKGDIFSLLPIVMPKLRQLSIHHILKATSESSNGDVSVFDFSVQSAAYGAMSKQIREHCVSLVQNLRNLQDFTITLELFGEINITSFAHRGPYTELEHKVIIEEVQLVKQLSIGNPTLTRVTVGDSWGNWSGPIRTFKFSALWKKIDTSLSEKGTDKVIWIPQPHLTPYWWVWFDYYHTPQDVREMMVKHWEQSDIPSLVNLEHWYSQNSIANWWA